jgi:phenylpropionate dioxygenase-like ring-hydroxylating dioxygenase large terminal subunit
MNSNIKLTPVGDDLSLTRNEVTSAWNLPPYMYTSPEIYAIEQREIFGKEWIYICRSDQVRNVGDYFSATIAGAPIFVVRDEQGSIKGNSAVCRHRGAVVVEEGQGNATSFRCHYHGWNYGYDGHLIDAPLMDKSKAFKPCENGLVAIQAQEWEGFIFVCLHAEAQSLSIKLSPLAERLRNFKLKDMRCTKTLTFDLDCNWKVYVENALEEYHSPSTHPNTLEPVMPMIEWITEAPGVHYETLINPRKSNYAEQIFPPIEGLGDDAICVALVYPNYVISPATDSMITLNIIPVAPGRIRLDLDIFFPESTVTRPDFHVHEDIYYEGIREFVEEDNFACVSTYRGLLSPLSLRGRYAYREEIVNRIHKYVLERIETMVSR